MFAVYASAAELSSLPGSFSAVDSACELFAEPAVCRIRASCAGQASRFLSPLMLHIDEHSLSKQ